MPPPRRPCLLPPAEPVSVAPDQALCCVQDEQTLIVHQREKHYRCPECSKKLNTAKALAVHCLNVHKRALTAVPAALDGREDPSWDIFGMAGVPPGMQPGDAPPPKPGKKGAAGAAVAPTVIPGMPPPGAMMPPPGMPGYGYPPPQGHGYPGGPP
jgi:hypothetical protein